MSENKKDKKDNEKETKIFENCGDQLDINIIKCRYKIINKLQKSIKVVDINYGIF